MADRIAGLTGGNGKVELDLKVKPELRVGAEPVAEAQRRIAGDRALATNDLADATGGQFLIN